jgi:hypothetical protein
VPQLVEAPDENVHDSVCWGSPQLHATQNRWARRIPSGQYAFDDFVMNVGHAEVSALVTMCQPSVVDDQQVHERLNSSHETRRAYRSYYRFSSLISSCASVLDCLPSGSRSDRNVFKQPAPKKTSCGSAAPVASNRGHPRFIFALRVSTLILVSPITGGGVTPFL